MPTPPAPTALLLLGRSELLDLARSEQLGQIDPSLDRLSDMESEGVVDPFVTDELDPPVRALKAIRGVFADGKRNPLRVLERTDHLRVPPPLGIVD